MNIKIRTKYEAVENNISDMKEQIIGIGERKW